MVYLQVMNLYHDKKTLYARMTEIVYNDWVW